MVLLDDTNEKAAGPHETGGSPFLEEDSAPFAMTPAGTRGPTPAHRLQALVDVADRARAGIGVAVAVVIIGVTLLAYRAQSPSIDTEPSAVGSGAAPSVVVAEPATAATTPSDLAGPVTLDVGRRADNDPTPDAPLSAAPPASSSSTVTQPSTTAAPSTAPPTTAATTVSTSPETTSPPDTPVPTTAEPPPPAEPLIIVRDDVYELDEGKKKTINVLDNDEATEFKLDKDSVQIISPPRHADEYEVDDGRIRYRSVDDFEGTDSLRYQVCDSAGNCGSATLTLRVDD
ncbi:MAG: hypothetical protein AAGK32_11640 [Actinomycetota bacterium]